MPRRPLKDAEIVQVLEEITDEQAENSELEGDSDAEDFIPGQASNDGSSRRRSSRPHSAVQQNLAEESDDEHLEDSDNSVEDPDYVESPPGSPRPAR